MKPCSALLWLLLPVRFWICPADKEPDATTDPARKLFGEVWDIVGLPSPVHASNSTSSTAPAQSLPMRGNHVDEPEPRAQSHAGLHRLARAVGRLVKSLDHNGKPTHHEETKSSWKPAWPLDGDADGAAVTAFESPPVIEPNSSLDKFLRVQNLLKKADS
eukprot:gnl/MRDRNA2_/MRDRNA2_108154_c0_seq1.p1 gnl/MRDRNA2_/MRDRNA2_108154_c0~~gnl/MRDRNA2_/MRDRNA2_108154_c0_seq1.p1  ORF type:complete len:160 (+),score=22.66 gnl/MRDRNA2_/MRDRNA2_108154_c0_seq1:172-651(+)